MKNLLKLMLLITVVFAFSIAYSSDDSSSDDMSTTDDDGTVFPTEMHAAFEDFDPDYTDIYLDGANVVLETIGVPNHPTPYYSLTHPLYIAPTVTSEAQMTPTRIDTSGRDFEATLTVSSDPQMANSTSATQLGSIGIAVSGAFIYNDQEGNGPLDSAAGSLDYAGAHIGPSNYHYHLEPLPFSDDDGNLIGIISDGFLFMEDLINLQTTIQQI